MNTFGREVSFPDIERVVSLIPRERHAYHAARAALQDVGRGLLDEDYQVASAVDQLHRDQQAGVLEPPLGDDLAAVVAEAAQFVTDGGITLEPGYNPDVAWQILDVVVEHGYRN